jgi:hypothetical protein
MIVVADSVPDGILLDVEQACVDLREAAEACRNTTDAVTQARLQACRDTMDAILDMWNEAGLS